HASGTTDEDDRPVARALQPGLQDHRHEIADVQARRRRVVTAIEGNRPLVEKSAETGAVGDVGQETACVEFVEDMHGAREPNAFRCDTPSPRPPSLSFCIWRMSVVFAI